MYSIWFARWQLTHKGIYIWIRLISLVSVWTEKTVEKRGRDRSERELRRTLWKYREVLKWGSEKSRNNWATTYSQFEQWNNNLQLKGRKVTISMNISDDLRQRIRQKLHLERKLNLLPAYIIINWLMMCSRNLIWLYFAKKFIQKMY